MKVVRKYHIPAASGAVLYMPSGAQILDIAVQKARAYIWALVDREETEMANQELLFLGTGQPVPANQVSDFLKTFHLPNGEAYHVFRLAPGQTTFDPDERDVLREALMVLYSVDTLFDNLNAKHPDLLDGEFWDVVIQVRQARQALERGVSK